MQIIYSFIKKISPQDIISFLTYISSLSIISVISQYTLKISSFLNGWFLIILAVIGYTAFFMSLRNSKVIRNDLNKYKKEKKYFEYFTIKWSIPTLQPTCPKHNITMTCIDHYPIGKYRCLDCSPTFIQTLSRADGTPINTESCIELIAKKHMNEIKKVRSAEEESIMAQI